MLGRLHGVETPTNEFLQRYAARLLRGEIQPGSVPAEKLDAEWEEWLQSRVIGLISGTDGSTP